MTVSRAMAPLSRMPSESAPRAASTPAPPSLVPEPPSPTTTRGRPALDGGEDQLADAVAAGELGAPVDQVQPDGLGALDVGHVLDEQDGRGHPLAVRGLDGDARAARRPARRGARRRTRARRRPSAPGRARRRARAVAHPVAMASAASTAVRVPANLSGAISTRMAPSCRMPPTPGRGGVARPAGTTPGRRSRRPGRRRPGPGGPPRPTRTPPGRR